MGPDERRGIAELNGEGEVASGIALQRFGANALNVITNIKARLAEIAPSLPKGVEVVPVYDRSELIYRAIETLRRTLLEESLVVALVCIVFLLHVRSALVAIIMLPVGILMSFMAMKMLGLGSNIMSLGGIAIAIGAMIDAAIVMIENAHKHLERAPPDKPRLEILVEAASEVGPALFFSLLIITVSFLPIFTLEAQEGRLFGPLAYTKTFAMAAAAMLSITLVPALMVLFVRGRIIPEHRNPLNRFLIAIYRPVIRLVLQAKTLTIVIALAVLAVSIWPVTRLGTEFMPNLNEGTLLYMPTTLPGLSVTKSAELLQMQDRIIRSFPEVESVYGKAGRAQTATDPAPIEMFETVINLKPKEQWRPGLTVDSLIQEMDRSLQFPGVSNAWTMPIKARIDMLSTGIRTPVGVKVIGKDLAEMEKIAREVEKALKTVAGNRQRLRRTRRRRLLSRDHSRPRPAGALWPDGLGRPGRGGDSARAPSPSPPPSKAANATRSPSAIRATCAPTRNPLPRTSWWPCQAAGVPCRWARWPTSGSPRAPPASAPRTPGWRPTSSSTSATAISAATSPTPRRRWQSRCNCPPAPTWCGAASSSIWNAPKPACRWWCR